jgi:DNA topoisomerase-1
MPRAPAGLSYVTDDSAGITRRRAGKGFAYRDAQGRLVRDRVTLARIRALAVPPAWTDVWICPNENGHLQATGRDARGRKQHRYHPRFREVRDAAKFDRLSDFAHKLPALRARVSRDMAKPGLPREKVLATIVRLLDTTLIRVGNDEYAKANGSYGLTTLKTNHAKVKGRRAALHLHRQGGQELEAHPEEQTRRQSRESGTGAAGTAAVSISG